MWILAFWIFASVLIGLLAQSKGLKPIECTLVSLLFSPFIGIIFVLWPPASLHAKSRPARAGVRTSCPYCAEDIKAAAVFCRHCQRELPPPVPPEPADKAAVVEKVIAPPATRAEWFWFIAVCVLVFLLARDWLSSPF